MNIIVNGRSQQWNEASLSYRQLVQIANPGRRTDYRRIYTITYNSGDEHGSLVDGQSVSARSDMVLNVLETVRA
jgi:hypothetical protein